MALVNGYECRKEQLDEITWGRHDTAQGILKPLITNTDYMKRMHRRSVIYTHTQYQQQKRIAVDVAFGLSDKVKTII